MKKIPSLFMREDAARGKASHVIDRVTPGCEWVLAGEGVATRKWDGTSVLVKGGKVFARYDAKVDPRTGERKTPPAGFVACQEPDPITGHWPGWVPARPKEDKWIIEAFAASGEPSDGTYEACGPKINGNAERVNFHCLMAHGLPDSKVWGRTFTSFDDIRLFLAAVSVEGIVWHHPDGRMAKIKTRDFGLEWPRA